MTDTTPALTWASFLTSSGFGGACAVLAAGIAYLSVRFRARKDKDLAIEADARDRWWEALHLLWDAKDKFLETDGRAVSDALYGLDDLVTTQEQSVILDAITVALFPETAGAEEEQV